MGTPHKEPGRLTPRSRKRAVFGRELDSPFACREGFCYDGEPEVLCQDLYTAR